MASLNGRCHAASAGIAPTRLLAVRRCRCHELHVDARHAMHRTPSCRSWWPRVPGPWELPTGPTADPRWMKPTVFRLRILGLRLRILGPDGPSVVGYVAPKVSVL